MFSQFIFLTQHYEQLEEGINTAKTIIAPSLRNFSF